MIAVVLGAAGIAVMALGVALLRSIGEGFRIARLLRAAPQATVAEAVELAGQGAAPPYLRVRGRIVSDEEFPDENDRPLVFRRRRVQVARGRGWTTLDEDRVAVPFALEERSSAIRIDHDALGPGLVVVPRDAEGHASDVPGAVPAGTNPNAAVRERVEQVSAVDIALACGVPTVGADGSAVLSAGRGRPLIVSTLEVPDAMRILAGGRRSTVVAASASLAAGSALLLAAAAAAVTGAGR